MIKAAKTGQDLNESYYDEVQSDGNDQREDQDPYDINQRRGYESSSTAHRELNPTAAKLKRKLAQFSKDETVTKGGSAEMLADSHYVDPEKDETHALFKTNKMHL